MLDAGLQHMLQLIFILRRHDDHVRHVAQIRIIECAVVRRPVFRNQPAAIDAEGHRQILRGDIVDHLVIRALQKGGIQSPPPAGGPASQDPPQMSPHAVRQSPHRRSGPEILSRKY